MNIKELQERYGITRTPLYSRLKALDITLAKDSNNQSIATDEQVTALDQLDEHLKSGGNLKTFVPSQQVTVLSPTEHDIVLSTTEHRPVMAEQAKQLNLFEDLLEVGFAIATKLKSPLENLRDLQEAADRGWLLDKQQLRLLLNKQKLPSKEFDYYGFRFTPEGKFYRINQQPKPY